MPAGISYTCPLCSLLLRHKAWPSQRSEPISILRVCFAGIARIWNMVFQSYDFILHNIDSHWYGCWLCYSVKMNNIIQNIFNSVLWPKNHFIFYLFGYSLALIVLHVMWQCCTCWWHVKLILALQYNYRYCLEAITYLVKKWNHPTMMIFLTKTIVIIQTDVYLCNIWIGYY